MKQINKQINQNQNRNNNSNNPKPDANRSDCVCRVCVWCEGVGDVKIHSISNFVSEIHKTWGIECNELCDFRSISYTLARTHSQTAVICMLMQKQFCVCNSNFVVFFLSTKFKRESARKHRETVCNARTRDILENQRKIEAKWLRLPHIYIICSLKLIILVIWTVSTLTRTHSHQLSTTKREFKMKRKLKSIWHNLFIYWPKGPSHTLTFPHTHWMVQLNFNKAYGWAISVHHQRITNFLHRTYVYIVS